MSTSVKHLSNFLSASSLEGVLDYFQNFLNSQDNEMFSLKTIEQVNPEDKQLFLQETITFLNLFSTQPEAIEKYFDADKPKYKLKDLVLGLNNLLTKHRASRMVNQLVSFEWQVGIVERMKNNVNLNKLDTVEITTKLTTKDASDTIKMKYAEFSEIFNNLKKIDSQLHMFKN